MVIDFDSSDWMPLLGDALLDSVPEAQRNALPAAQIEYYEEALDMLVDGASTSRVVDDTLAWIRSNSVRAYHGTRLTDDEADAMRRDGLRPLSIKTRIDWLRASFPPLASALTEAVITEAMNAGQLQYRENQVHAAISRGEMFTGYDYLFEGSEFDRRLLEWGGHPELVSVLRTRGAARLVKLVLPGDEALAAMHPFFSIEDVRTTDVYPNLVRELLRAWAWQLHKPDDTRFRVDACLMFRGAVPSAYVEDIEVVEPRN